ncbi:hypothetical protein COV89_00925 [Candidatus Shapirobacteria bacterium CG11_big_fil_rev_8_21_14_0_20_40_12]|uniref:Calcineurin-like phosphoesterase domain-containing protein n=3 Tax=Candidatus Shapironibacteriota TaxID=1752721 RepID=A0A2M8EV26_9BACT|nr:MAG: hypothetical protein COV89_00925 [Candidatus Shapirobacteria bacterium CG11_big_fil_rev_8_21_14_0_20_40_12]PJC28926.1 MAG: hypothetical protein CO053_02070 [Candidatus Shapirobacteria bacterium CG_4_9_14_0_2_um_filter_40_11]PJC77617.1 MAG: hypothetical protein CO010_00110 [Candidatus Shapirobacteria bacterium CG_4_8_14_3_um_filter_39_11]
MKLLKKVLVLLLVGGVVSGVVWTIREKQTRLFPPTAEFGEARKPLKFAVMADVHSDWGNFKIAIEKAKKDESEFVIIAGDLTTIGKKEEFLEAKKILDESGLKYYVIPGNHDIWWGRRFKQNLWGEVFEKSFMSFNIEDKKFILVNNGDGENGLEASGGQEEWLRREVEECLKAYCLVFLHEPLNHPTSSHIMGEENLAVATQAAQLVKLLVKNKVEQIFAGHLHFSSSYELEDLKTTIVGAITSERNFQSPKFLEVSALEETISKKEIFLDD